MQGEARLRGLWRNNFSKTIISVAAWGARLRECSTPSIGFNLCENCYNIKSGRTRCTFYRCSLTIRAGCHGARAGCPHGTVEGKMPALSYYPALTARSRARCLRSRDGSHRCMRARRPRSQAVQRRAAPDLHQEPALPALPRGAATRTVPACQEHSGTTLVCPGRNAS